MNINHDNRMNSPSIESDGNSAHAFRRSGIEISETGDDGRHNERKNNHSQSAKENLA